MIESTFEGPEGEMVGGWRYASRAAVSFFAKFPQHWMFSDRFQIINDTTWSWYKSIVTWADERTSLKAEFRRLKKKVGPGLKQLNMFRWL